MVNPQYSMETVDCIWEAYNPIIFAISFKQILKLNTTIKFASGICFPWKFFHTIKLGDTVRILLAVTSFQPTNTVNTEH